MKRIFIVEDDPLIADTLEAICEDIGYHCIGIEDNSEDALKEISAMLPDLVLLDINLEGEKDGVFVAETLSKETKIPFVFITAYVNDNTLKRCSATQPSGYIVKPFKTIDVKVAIEMAFMSPSKIDKEVKDITVNKDGTFYIKSPKGYRKITLEEVKYIKADDIYAILYTLDGHFLVGTSLKSIELQFSPFGFIRVHKSYIINKKYIDELQERQIIIGNDAIPIGRSYKQKFLEQLNFL